MASTDQNTAVMWFTYYIFQTGTSNVQRN